MTAVLILMVIFGGIALITYVDNSTKAQRRALPEPDVRTPATAAALPAPADPSGGAETLILDLPEPARAAAWTLLCDVVDALKAGSGDARTTYLLTQTRDAYLPDTLRAYHGLTDGARRTLSAQGQPPETLLHEQLRLLEDGVREALRHDHATADRLLAQGRFLRERFGQAEGNALTLPGPARPLD
ncbi:hypothetical protein HNQ07_000862 [Deinococcus metalli]|uniref:Uncharacterized protein n=1 Tax=Deinococcus metalli TaxID=1141878 RepID=A0A7W8KCX6_9DEIO|nr:hypothetical protein [Deinococcus metalli]MBB5375418.1 hypothetical protein [Deinococcus metalli]GHF29433.1 hypothetical protein GCM10017781_01770 [Deinococcus metalli]